MRLSCNPNIEWMHCDSTVDSNGTWRESWYALEVLYMMRNSPHITYCTVLFIYQLNNFYREPTWREECSA